VPAAAGSVFLPPNCASAIARRYRSGCSGYSAGAEQWSKEIHAPRTSKSAIAKSAREMIQFGHHGRLRPLPHDSLDVATGLVLRSLIAAVLRQIADLILA